MIIGLALLILAAIPMQADDASALPLIDSPELAKREQQRWSEALGLPVEWTNELGITFCLVPPGRFVMGTGVDSDAPRRTVAITRPFYMGKTEVTRAQWEAATGTTHSDYFPGADLPISYISGRDVRILVKRLSKLEGKHVYRLPTEAEWEFAARAGSTTDFAGGDDDAAAAEVAWTRSNSKGTLQPVATLAPNAWGLYDMQGNAWEWCHDFYDEGAYRLHQPEDPTGPSQSLYGYKVLRGGSALHDSRAARAGNRAYYQGGRSEAFIGLRLVREIALEDGEGK